MTSGKKATCIGVTVVFAILIGGVVTYAVLLAGTSHADAVRVDAGGTWRVYGDDPLRSQQIRHPLRPFGFLLKECNNGKKGFG